MGEDITPEEVLDVVREQGPLSLPALGVALTRKRLGPELTEASYQFLVSNDFPLRDMTWRLISAGELEWTKEWKVRAL